MQAISPRSRQSRDNENRKQMLPPRGDVRNKKKGTKCSTQGELRVAYKAQKRNHNNVMADDQHSTSSGATPSSVYMPSSVVLARDNMSDLSGLSGGTHRGSTSIPGQIFDPKSLLKKPWHQAYELSNISPEKIMSSFTSYCDNHDNNSNKNNRSVSKTRLSPGVVATGGGNINSFISDAKYLVAQNDVIEIINFNNMKPSLGLDRYQIMGQHSRVPIILILIKPSDHSYEILQIWVDREIDSIRDLVQILQHQLPNRWTQKYDGIFQIRGSRFTNLINIIKLVKYDIKPHEILVAKPLAMTAKVTIAFASSAIQHLTSIGVISTDNGTATKNDDVPLVLSKSARDRCYFPQGLLNHHHAIQFITFSPSFESTNYATGAPSINQSASLRDSLEHNSSNPSSMIATEINNDNDNNNRLIHFETKCESKHATTTQRKRNQWDRNGGRFFSKLNCFRNVNSGVIVTKKNDSAGINYIDDDKEITTTEVENRWLSFNMKPIAEDQSTSGSIVSMSAPLLSQSSTNLTRRHTVHPKVGIIDGSRYNANRIISNECEL